MMGVRGFKNHGQTEEPFVVKVASLDFNDLYPIYQDQIVQSYKSNGD